MEKRIVSVVLGSYNRRAFLKPTLESVRSNMMDLPYEIIVVDGGSTDGSLKYLASQKDVITIIQHNRGEFRGKAIERRSWGYFMNLGFKSAQGKYILMVSDDCLLIPGAVKNGIEQFEKLLAEGRKIGARAFYWRNWPETEKYRVGYTFGNKLFVNHGLYLRSAVEEVGWIDEERYQFYHADGDLCLRLWQSGYESVDCPTSLVEHYRHANTKARKENLISARDDWNAYFDRWKKESNDLSQNLTGGWLYLDFVDESDTAKSFPSSIRFAVKMKIWIRYCWENYCRPIIRRLRQRISS